MKKILVVLTLMLISNLTQANNQIEIIVPNPPGGAVDLVARAINQEINQKTDLNTIVVNRPGASGQIAGQYFLSQPADKIYLVSTGSSLFLKLTNSNLSFDPINNFQIIGPVATTPTILAVSEKSSIANLADFIKQARHRNFNCGVSNSMATFFGEYFASSRGLKLTIIPYKGSAPLLTDVIGGHLDCVIDASSVYIGQKGIRVIGLTVPDLTHNFKAPVMTGANYNFENFYAVALSKNMNPKTRIKIINVLKSLHKDPAFIKSMTDRGIVVNQKFDLDFNTKLNQDFNYLYDQRLQIQKSK